MAEKENKNSKKQSKPGGKVILVLLLIIVILLAIMFLFDPFGLGIGLLGKGSGNSSGGGAGDAQATEAVTAADTTVPEDTDAAEETADPQAYLDVTVKGSTYFMGQDETTIQAVVDMINEYSAEHGETVAVKIFDDSATQNAMDDLMNSLTENGIGYKITD